MMVCYALEHKSTWFILGFALACGLGSIYGFLQGAWPFGVVEAVWMLVAARRWMIHRGIGRRGDTIRYSTSGKSGVLRGSTVRRRP